MTRRGSSEQELERAFYAAVRRRTGRDAEPAPSTVAEVRRDTPPVGPIAAPGRPDGGRAAGDARPMSFSADLAEAVRAGRKTATRRPMRPQPAAVEGGVPMGRDGRPMWCPIARPRGTLWLREPWRRDGDVFAYAADGARGCNAASFMPRAACRTILRVTAVGCARLQLVTPAQARAEGAPAGHTDPVAWFAAAWDAFYGSGDYAWRLDPWVWAVTFEVEKPAQNQVAAGPAPRVGHTVLPTRGAGPAATS